MSVPEIFDRALLRRRRERAAADFAAHDFLFVEAAARLAERLGEVRRSFACGLDLGCHTGELARALPPGLVDSLVQCDLSQAMLGRAEGPRVVADEERLPFRAGVFDLVASVLSLHWTNDLPGALAQAATCLKPDGLLLVTLFGGGTLAELRHVFDETELAETGIGGRISPFVDIRDAGGLLQRAGLALPVVDCETVTVSYEEPLRLLGDLRGMGESNVLVRRPRRPLSRQRLARAMALYRERFAGDDGRVPASFELLTLTAWKPHPDQPQPLAPGSGAVPLSDMLGRKQG
jgi:NADH dehydrogenase [ubiquinone] 1 alpha subcomplex assembly factor 5